jgi:3-oxoacyl-[acyl-carrier protein] reductase
MPIAFVTGATAGIGRALAFALGRAGWQVGVCSRSPAKVGELLAALRVEGLTAAGAAADVGNELEVERIVATVQAELGSIDTLVNNAGILVNHRIEDLSVADWDATMATNLRSLFLTTRLVLPGMRERRSGDIVNIASLAGRNGLIGGTAYSASKHAVLGFSKSLMLETRKDGIRVIAICPGSVNTGLLVDQPHLKSNLDKALAPEDVADTVVQALRLPRRALLSEIDIRPSDP